MMMVREQELNRQQVARWWQIVKTRNRLFLRLANAEADEIRRLRNIDRHLEHLKQEYELIDQSIYPPDAERIRQALLAAMINLIACLQHAQHDNEHERDVLFEIAAVDVKMMETYLWEQDLSL